MIDELIDLSEDIDVPPPRVRLDDPQPWFLKFTEPILESEKKDGEPMFPWPPGAPRPLVFKTEVTLQEVLDFICPPIRISEDGHHWRQQVSDELPNRTYEAFLKQKLNESLQNARSRFSGFCPIRNKIYRDVFSEAIRVVSVGMKERGLMLMRVKDDIDTTVDRMERLYRSSMGYGIRKQLRVDEKKLKLEMMMDDMREETYILRMMSKDFVSKSRAALEELRDRREKLLDKKLYDLELLKQATCLIEKTIFRIICAETKRQRARFFQACLEYKDATEEVVHKDDDFTGNFTEEKIKTPSSSAVFAKESTTLSSTDPDVLDDTEGAEEASENVQ